MKKDTKTFIIGNEHIFDDAHLDERQKAEAYKITFQLFIAMIYAMLFVSTFVFVYAAATANIPMLITGAAAGMITQLFIILYAAMTSSKGAMNLEFAKKNSKPSYLVIWIGSAIMMYFIMIYKMPLEVSGIFILLYVLLYFVEFLLLFYFSRRNMKILEKQLKDDDDETDQ